MPKALLSLLALLVASVAACAQVPTIKLPTEVKGEPGSFIAVRAETEGRTVRWVSLTPGLFVFPGDLLADRKATVVSSVRQGRYQLLAYTAKGDEPSEPAIVTIIIGDSPPTPPPPGPVPPGPGPDPVDAFTKKIRDVLASDPGAAAEKAKYAAALAGFYAAMAKHVSGGQTATVGDLLADYKAAIPAVLPEGAILATRRLCGQEVAAVCGDDADRKIDAQLKTNLVSLFEKLSAALTVEAKGK